VSTPTREVGIVGFGAYVPRRRIRSEEIAAVWGADADAYKRGLGLAEKSVPARDQDTITMSVEAALHAIRRADIDPAEIGGVYVGSESHPYAVKPSGTLVAEAIGATPEVHCADLEFACKAGTEAMYVALAMVSAGDGPYALAIGADTAQGAPGDAAEYSAAAGAAAFLMGSERVLAVCERTYSLMSDTPDFWRREGQFYPVHAERFTGEPAYMDHVVRCAEAIMAAAELAPDDFAWVVFHQPNGKFPLRVAKRLGFTPAQVEPGHLAPLLGNTYSGSAPMGLSAVLDVAKPGERILLCSYGSGAGSDGFIFRVTEHIEAARDRAPHTRAQLADHPIYLSYAQYAKMRRKLRVH